MYALQIVKKVLFWTHINLSEFLVGKDRLILLPDFHEIQFSYPSLSVTSNQICLSPWALNVLLHQHSHMQQAVNFPVFFT